MRQIIISPLRCFVAGVRDNLRSPDCVQSAHESEPADGTSGLPARERDAVSTGEFSQQQGLY